MKKKLTVIAAVLVCASCIAVGAVAGGVIRDIQAQLRPDFTIEIDGEVKTFKNVNGEVVYPVLYEGTTYLPVRAIGEIMGKTVYWTESKKLIELKTVEAPTVTDADVIVDETVKTPEKPALPEKPKDGEVTLPVEPKPPVLPAAAEYITEQEAKEIALNDASATEAEVRFEKVEFDRDDGRFVYEIEFKKGNVEYEYEISAIDGKIVSREADRDD